MHKLGQHFDRISSQQPLHKCLEQKTWERINLADVFVHQVLVGTQETGGFPIEVTLFLMLRNHRLWIS